MVFSIAPKVILVIIFSLTSASCSEDQLAELGTLERNLLLTWIALERNDEDRVAAYNEDAQKAWTAIRGQYRDAHLSKPLLQSAGRVDLWMLNLRNAVEYKQPGRALMAVNLMQNELTVLRPQLGLNHPADQLYEFYHQWQDIVEASNDPMLCLLEWNEFEHEFAAANATWRTYLKSRPRFMDNTFPGLGKSASQSESSAVALTQGLDAFASLLKEGNHTLVAAPSRAINEMFFDYLAVITDYQSAQKAI
ncbi:hypothetical protein FUA23_21175 [Neolewinella aurantiaca]|uniref:Uncharacterized protein n=1 Tax=Neolewinella aurantiaca TaxID=2602767 RepID=A0A5C7FFB1_9BACT|nr:hypothetical protein [Neolewinella aurantiaca]TXF84373.1 hypothetical protein FUA23_21175 [Neolewinella aurantiaca]